MKFVNRPEREPKVSTVKLSPSEGLTVKLVLIASVPASWAAEVTAS